MTEMSGQVMCKEMKGRDVFQACCCYTCSSENMREANGECLWSTMASWYFHCVFKVRYYVPLLLRSNARSHREEGMLKAHHTFPHQYLSHKSFKLPVLGKRDTYEYHI